MCSRQPSQTRPPTRADRGGVGYRPHHMIRVRSIERDDQPWVVRRLGLRTRPVTVARKGVLIDASVLPGFVATDGERPVGLLTYDAAHGECEVVAIISTEEGRGIGRALMDAARDHAASGSSLPTTTPGPFASTSSGV
jgi:GNAT superfamily N-acetyltransferase